LAPGQEALSTDRREQAGPLERGEARVEIPMSVFLVRRLRALVSKTLYAANDMHGTLGADLESVPGAAPATCSSDKFWL
jgi:hypothetical protein